MADRLAFTSRDHPEVRVKQLNALLTRVIALEGGGPGGVAGVTTFNTRSGDVMLGSGDVTGALGYTPLSAASNLADLTNVNSARTNLGLLDNPTFGGTTVVDTLDATGNIALVANDHAFIWRDANSSFPQFKCQNDNNLVLYGTDAAGGLRPIFSVFMRSSTSTFGFAVPVTGLTATPHDSSTKFATTEFVHGELFLTPNSTGSGFTISDAHNNQLIQLLGSTAGQTVTALAGTAGLSVIFANLSTVAWTFSCPNGAYKDGSNTTVTTVNIPVGTRFTAVHIGAGVWILSGL